MSNIKTVAWTEFGAIVRTKAFIVSLLILPIMMTISIGLQALVSSAEQGKPFKVAVLDETGGLYPTIAAQVALINAENEKKPTPGATIEISELTPTGSLDELKLDLSEKIRNKDLGAFIILPAGLLASPPTENQFYFHASEARGFGEAFNGLVRQALFTTRLAKSGLTPQQMTEVLTPPKLERRGLYKLGPDGKLAEADKLEGLLDILLPMGMMVLLFLLVMMSTQPLLSTVLEEKMSRISEVLLGMVSPFDLMMGKLIGSLGASMLLALLYVGTGLGILTYMGYLSLIPVMSVVYLLLFLFPAVFLFGSLYLAVGAACNDFKDAQTLLTPFMLILTMPMIASSLVITDPNGPIATVLSLFPPATPFLMLLRVTLRPGPPLWQIPVSLLLTFATATFIVFLAGRIFRTGLLMQGKTPTLKELLRWAMVR